MPRQLSVEAILARAAAMRAAGADVIDLGCLPDTPFPHLEDAVRELKAAGFAVSVDSADADELRRGGTRRRRFLLSLTEDTLDLAERHGRDAGARFPASHGDLASLLRAAEEAEKRGLAFIARPGPRSDPFRLHGLALRYRELRARAAGGRNADGHRQPDRADRRRFASASRRCCSGSARSSASATCSSSRSARTRAARSQEHDAARRIMYAAREDRSLPQGYGGALLQLHDRKPFPQLAAGDRASSPREVQRRQFPHRDRRGRNPRLQPRRPSCRRRTRSRCSPSSASRATAPHAFYLGAELMKAEIALAARQALRAGRAARLGLRAPTASAEDRTRLREAGHTLRAQDQRADAMPLIRETHRHDRRSRRRACTSRRSASSPRVRAGSSRRSVPRRRSTICAPVPFAVANYTDDVRIFAGCLTGRRRLADHCRRHGAGAAAAARSRMRSWRWPRHRGRPAAALSLRRRAPRTARAVPGLQPRQGGGDRSRHPGEPPRLLPREKVETEIAYLAIAIEKTAGAEEPRPGPG